MAETHHLPTPDLHPTTVHFQTLNKEAEERAKSCQPATVPYLDHLKMADYNVVYEPSDDTYLMMDGLSYDFNSGGGNSAANVRTTLELGCGTGVSTIYLAQLLAKLKHNNVKHYVTDINTDAIRVTMETIKANNLELDNFEARCCDLATPLLAELREGVDVLIFNPPYVPTPDDEVGSSGIEASWAGGTHGRVVLDRALPQIASLLSWPNGAAYIITVDDNKPEDIAKLMMDSYGIRAEPLVRRKARNEYLSVIKMSLMKKFEK
jgi:release factor glutamine methyltransferase